jgi:4-hydroxy-3-methylbut-2-enyl diphosphate reductase
MINPGRNPDGKKHMALEILVARDSSFCPGVDRAMRKTEKKLAGKKGPVYSFGPLIHNPQVVSNLRSAGLETLEPGSDFPDLRGVPVVIRSHGIDIEGERALAERGAKLVDATCNTVKRAQRAAQELAEAGYRVVVLGSPRHPEVRSIIGRSGADVTVISDIEEAERFAEEAAVKPGPVGIVCQTTISHTLLDSVVSLLRSRGMVVEVRDTICKWVALRQQEAMELSKRVDLMMVVGGRDSSNTAQLAAICSASGVSTHHIEDPSEIMPEWLEGVASVGITGGASTPDWLIDETKARLKEMASG